MAGVPGRDRPIGWSPIGGGSWSRRGSAVMVEFPALLGDRRSGRASRMYKEFAIEAIVWLIPVVILVGLAYMITRPA